MEVFVSKKAKFEAFFCLACYFQIFYGFWISFLASLSRFFDDAFLWLFFCGYVFPRTVNEAKKAIILCIS